MSSEYHQEQLYVSPLQNNDVIQIACQQSSYMKYTLESEEQRALFQHSNKFRNFEKEQTDVGKSCRLRFYKIGWICQMWTM